MTIKRTLASEWASLEAAVLHGKSTVQRTECRRMFYAGAQGLLSIIMESLSPDKEPTQADVDKMNRLNQELLKFHEDLLGGRA